ncbi:hypothetical protein CC86DRAFT_288434 [Ophiobolus disseminans]|uniref:Uncharacterized protein n=1 Tax=Ophiobolus disseminans TaxID=1469910 RepID=A0A6A7A6G4_9PLEO|nr:hypothetical protein CC86DRAFT_288434 [Ophiobolus disseminans]
MFNVTFRIGQKGGSRKIGNTTVNTISTQLKSHICNVTGGIVEYKVQLSSQTVKLASNRSEDRFLQDQTLPGPGIDGHHSTIGGFQYAASYLFTSSAIYDFHGAKSWTTFAGSLANEMVGENETFSDPMDGMLDKMREIAFRTAVRAGRDRANVTDAAQSVNFHGSGTHAIYVTHTGFMVAAAALSIASIVAIAVLFYGWWELGRSVYYTPLDIAKAFDAPLLAPLGSNLDLSRTGNLKPVAAEKVRYGEQVIDHASKTQYVGGNREHGRRRLVMGLSSDIKRPRAGQVYGN